MERSIKSTAGQLKDSKKGDSDDYDWPHWWSAAQPWPKISLRLSLQPDFFYTSHNTLHTMASSKHNGVDDYDDDDVDVGFS